MNKRVPARIPLCGCKAFARETQLVQALLKFLRSTGLNGWSIALELDAGVGLADVVLYRASSAFDRALSRVNPRLAVLCDESLATGLTSIEAFASQLGMSTANAKKTVAILKTQGLVSTHRDELVMRTLAPQFSDVIAIEAKLANWRSALVQAYRNRQFANQSWVLLDHARFIGDERIDEFRRSGVGLATLSTGGCLYVHTLATYGAPFSLQRAWHAQATLSRWRTHRFRPSK